MNQYSTKGLVNLLDHFEREAQQQSDAALHMLYLALSVNLYLDNPSYRSRFRKIENQINALKTV
jgi:hypothetical protein